MWQKKDSKQIFTNSRVSLVEDTVILTDGTETDYVRFAGDPQSVVAIIKNKAGEILILHEYTWPNDTMVWNFPGGMVDKGEDLLTALKREAMEEAGCTIKNIREIGVMFPYHRRSTEQLHVYTAELDEIVEQQLEAEEEIELHWKTQADISQLLRDEDVSNAHSLGVWAFYLLDPENES